MGVDNEETDRHPRGRPSRHSLDPSSDLRTMVGNTPAITAAEGQWRPEPGERGDLIGASTSPYSQTDTSSRQIQLGTGTSPRYQRRHLGPRLARTQKIESGCSQTKWNPVRSGVPSPAVCRLHSADAY